jgi:3-phosphoshikimate 1-carboxyvinyltransferase
VHDLLDSDDTRVMLARCSNWAARSSRDGVLHVTGLGGRLAVHEPKLFLGNAGTAMRPLAAALAVLAATQGGASAARRAAHARAADRRPGRCAAAAGLHASTTWASPATRRCACAACRRPLATAAPIRVRGDVSSQFLTALLLALPLVSRTDAMVIEVRAS